MANEHALARPAQPRDARNARGLGAETQMKHHATSTRFNVDILIACCNNCVDVYAGRQKNVQRRASGHLPQGTSGQIYTPWHRGACNARGLGAETQTRHHATWPRRGDANDAPRDVASARRRERRTARHIMTIKSSHSDNMLKQLCRRNCIQYLV